MQPVSRETECVSPYVTAFDCPESGRNGLVFYAQSTITVISGRSKKGSVIITSIEAQKEEEEELVLLNLPAL